MLQREAGSCTEMPKAAEIEVMNPHHRAPCAGPQLRSRQAPFVHRESRWMRGNFWIKNPCERHVNNKTWHPGLDLGLCSELPHIFRSGG